MGENVFLRKGLQREELVKKHGRCPIKWDAINNKSEYSCETHQCYLHVGHPKKCRCHCGKPKPERKG